MESMLTHKETASYGFKMSAEVRGECLTYPPMPNAFLTNRMTA
jgi:hypothetical protein